MHKSPWQLQDAKAQFSALVEAALGGEAQVVTRRGKRAVVVLDAVEYGRLRRGQRAQAPGFIEHLLAMPRTAEAHPQSAGEPPTIRLRDVVLK